MKAHAAFSLPRPRHNTATDTAVDDASQHALSERAKTGERE
jgi:hypothetical protein